MVGNDDPLEKKEKDTEILDLLLPGQAYFLSTREPMLNYADAELCGKWKVRTLPPRF
jgi:DNA excision repair protein ERCC-6-like 2